MEVLEREREKFQETASVPLAGGTEGSSWRFWNLDVWRRLGLRHPRREHGPWGWGFRSSVDVPLSRTSLRLQTPISEKGVPSSRAAIVEGVWRGWCCAGGGGKHPGTGAICWLPGTSPFSLFLPLVLPLVHCTVRTQGGAGREKSAS